MKSWHKFIEEDFEEADELFGDGIRIYNIHKYLGIPFCVLRWRYDPKFKHQQKERYLKEIKTDPRRYHKLLRDNLEYQRSHREELRVKGMERYWKIQAERKINPELNRRILERYRKYNLKRRNKCNK